MDTHSPILDARGNKQPSSASTSYNNLPFVAGKNRFFEGATTGNRLGTWAAQKTNINREIYSGLEILANRCKALCINNPLAKSGLQSMVTNLIKSGISPIFQMPGEELQKQATELFEEWRYECDATGLLDFYGMQALVARSMLMSGEAFILVNYLPLNSSDIPVPLELRVIESDQVPSKFNTDKWDKLPEGNIVRMGIEFNKQGKRAAYWIFPEHPGDWSLNGLGYTNQDFSRLIRVPAENVRHCFRVLFGDQIRGIPEFTSIIVMLKMYDTLQDADLVRRQVGAELAGFVEQEMNSFSYQNTGASVGTPTKDQPDPSALSLNIVPGTMGFVPPGYKANFAPAMNVGSNVPEANEQLEHIIASGMGVPYFWLTGNLKSVNYSSIRAGLLEARADCEAIQNQNLIPQFLRPVGRTFLTIAYLAGALPMPADFATNPRPYLKIKWQPDKWPWVDPLKDIKAKILEIRAGLISQQIALGERGMNTNEILEQTRSWLKELKDMHIVLDSVPSQTTQAGVIQKTDTTK